MEKEKVETSIQDNTGDSIIDVSQRKLYVRFPHRVPPLEEVMQLSPSIISVNYPRQKSARFCHIILKSEAAVPEVLKLLNKKKYNNGRLIVELPRKLQYKQTEQDLNVSVGSEEKKERNGKAVKKHKGNENQFLAQNNAPKHSKTETQVEQSSGGKYVLKKRKVKPVTGGDNDRRLWMKKLPFSADEKELLAAFPGCIWARVFKRKGSKASRAICKFSTAKQAASILADPKKHHFKGQDILVELAKSQQLRGFGEGKKSVQKLSNQTGDFISQQLVVKSGQEESNVAKLEETASSDNEEVMEIQESEAAIEEEGSDDISENANGGGGGGGGGDDESVETND